MRVYLLKGMCNVMFAQNHGISNDALCIVSSDGTSIDNVLLGFITAGEVIKASYV